MIDFKGREVKLGAKSVDRTLSIIAKADSVVSMAGHMPVLVMQK